jgi:hypothetical protein
MMAKTRVRLAGSLVLLAVTPAVRADRQYQLCDPAKSVLCGGLTAIYEFEEASDAARTSEIGGNELVEPDGSNVANSSTHKTGTYSLAHTAAANSYLYVPRSTGPTGQFTVSLWILVDTVPSASTKRVQVLSTRNSLGNEGYPRVYLYHNGTNVVFRYEVIQGITDAVTTLTSTQSISTGTWYLVTFGQYPSPTASEPYQSTLWMEVNAGTRNTTTIAYPDVLTLGDFIVGGWLNTSPTEYGAYKIDQLCAWDGTLSPADVDTLYNSGAGKSFPFVD